MHTAEDRIRRNIQEILVRRDMKQGGFARAAGKSTPWASAYLRGKFRFPLHRLDEVAGFLEVTPEDLVKETDCSQSDDHAEFGKLITFPNVLQRPYLRLWYGPPPHFVIARAKFSKSIKPPIVPEDQVVGTQPSDYWPEEQLQDFLHMLEETWNGKKLVSYYAVTSSEKTHWRRGTYERKGDLIASEVQEIPADNDIPDPFDMTEVIQARIRKVKTR